MSCQQSECSRKRAEIEKTCGGCVECYAKKGPVDLTQFNDRITIVFALIVGCAGVAALFMKKNPEANKTIDYIVIGMCVLHFSWFSYVGYRHKSLENWIFVGLDLVLIIVHTISFFDPKEILFHTLSAVLCGLMVIYSILRIFKIV